MPVRLSAPARRRQLLEVALQAFGHQSYYSTSMAEIAKHAGVTKPVLYQHFDSKRALYLAVLERAGDHLVSTIEGAATDAPGPREQVEQGFTAYIGFLAENQAAFRVLLADVNHADREFASAAASVEKRLAAILADLIDIPELSSEERLLLAHGLIGLAQTAAAHWLANGMPVPAAGLAKRLAELAWFGLRGPGPTPA